MYYTYRIYGLSVQSDICIKEAVPIIPIDKVDVKIYRSALPANIKKEQIDGNDHFFTKNYMWFSVEGVGTYEILSGDTIHVIPCQDASISLVKSILLGTAFSCLLMQRDIIPVHGACVYNDRHCLILSGQSGSGKSTIATGLRKRGYLMAADDISALHISESGVAVYPAYPQQKICRDVAKRFDYNLDDLVYLGEDKDKYGVLLHDSFNLKEKQLTAMIILECSETDNVITMNITGHDKLIHFLNNIYRGFIYDYIGMPPRQMKKCLTFCNSIPMLMIKRPKKEDTIDQVISIINEYEGKGLCYE